MKVRSKNSIPRASRVFTDREEPRASFWKKYQKSQEDLQQGEGNVSVLAYYGIGGIGKSSLLKKLMSEMDERIPQPRYLYFDFNVYQESRVVLDRIKNKLEDDYKYTFPLFDLGNYVYAKKIGEKADSLEVKQLTDRSPILSNLMNLAGNLPVIGIAAQVLSLADQGVAMIRSYLKEHSRELAQIEYMEAEELYNYLPELFAEDMAHNLERETVPMVFFLDTYERVVNELAQVGEPLKNDEWIRGEYGLVQNIPGVLWVIAGREKLKWERFDAEWASALEQHILGSLSVADSEQFLMNAGVGNAQLRSALYKLTGGTPVYLDLCVDQYLRILARGESPTAEMFGTNTFDLIERFARYMGESQKDMVYMLSCLRQWSDELIADIGGRILPNFSLSAYEKVKDFSFIIQSDNGYFNIHQTVGDVLFGECPKLLKERTAECLLEHFQKDVAAKRYFAPNYTMALNYVMQAGVITCRDGEQFRVFYEENLRDALIGLAKAGRMDQANALLDTVQTFAEKEPQSRLMALYWMDESYLQYLQSIYDPEAKLATQAYELYCSLLGEDHPDSLRALSNVGDILYEGPDIERMLQIDRTVFEKRRAALGEDHPDTLEAMGKLAASVTKSGDDRAALQLKQEVLERRSRILGQKHESTVKAMAALASTLRDLGSYQEALELKKKALEIRREVLGEDHLATISSLQSLASTLDDMGKFQEALALYEVALEKRRMILGEGHRLTLVVMNNMAITLESMGNFSKALEMKQYVYDTRLRVYGEEHPSTLSAMNNLAISLETMGDYSKALEMKTYVYETRRRILGEDHPDTLVSMNNYAIALGNAGEREKALKLEEELLRRRTAVLGEDHPDTLTTMNNYAISLENAGEREKALELKEEVLRRRTVVLGEDHPDTLSAMSNLAVAYWGLGDKIRTRELEERVLDRYRVIYGNTHAKTLRAMKNLSITLDDCGELEHAVQLREEVLEGYRETLGQDHSDTLSVMNWLIDKQWELKNYRRTAELEEQLLQIRRRLLGEDNKSTLITAYNLCITLSTIDENEKAAELLAEIVEKRRRLLGNDHADTLKAIAKLADVLWKLDRKAETAELEQELLQSRRRVLGEDDSATISAAYNLSITLVSLDRLEEALELRKEVVEKRRRLLGEDHEDTRKAIRLLERLEEQMTPMDDLLSLGDQQSCGDQQSLDGLLSLDDLFAD